MDVRLEAPSPEAAPATDAGPAFYLEHKRLNKNGIQPYFPLAHVHQLEIPERLIRKGVYIGPCEPGVGDVGGGNTARLSADFAQRRTQTPAPVARLLETQKRP